MLGGVWPSSIPGLGAQLRGTAPSQFLSTALSTEQRRKMSTTTPTLVWTSHDAARPIYEYRAMSTPLHLHWSWRGRGSLVALHLLAKTALQGGSPPQLQMGRVHPTSRWRGLSPPDAQPPCSHAFTPRVTRMPSTQPRPSPPLKHQRQLDQRPQPPCIPTRIPAHPRRGEEQRRFEVCPFVSGRRPHTRAHQGRTDPTTHPYGPSRAPPISLH